MSCTARSGCCATPRGGARDCSSPGTTPRPPWWRDSPRAATGDWIRTFETAENAKLGRVRGRRLTSSEVERSLQDLLGVDIPLADQLPEESRSAEFTTVADGHKPYTASLWAMCGDYFPVEKLAEALPTFGWAKPEQVQLIMDPVPDDRPPPTVYRIDKEGETWLD